MRELNTNITASMAEGTAIEAQKDSMDRINDANQSHDSKGAWTPTYRNSFGRNSARLCRQTFHSCAPGVGYQK